MHVIEHIHNAKDKTLISFEILPPLKGGNINGVYDVLDKLMEFKPSFINVTYHSSEFYYKPKKDGTFEKIVVRKRPGTVGICAAIINRYKVDAVPHMICTGFTVEETEDALIDLHYVGIDNVLVLRGDPHRQEIGFTPEPGGHAHAIELLHQVKDMNMGKYLENDAAHVNATNFCTGVAGYPEKHYEAPNMAMDLKYLKAKVDAGAEYIVTQMFFDNKHYFNFVKECRAAGITVPIIPGIKPITSSKQLVSLPRMFHLNLPDTLVNSISACKNEDDVKKVGIEWCVAQCKELIKEHAPVLHFYTMSSSKPTVDIVAQLV